MSATKENLAFSSISGEYEIKGYEEADDSDYQYNRDVELFGLGVRLHNGAAWMWFSGYKFGCAVVTDKMEEYVWRQNILNNYANNLKAKDIQSA